MSATGERPTGIGPEADGGLAAATVGDGGGGGGGGTVGGGDQEARLLAAEQAMGRLSRLQSLTSLLSGAKSRDDVCTVVVHHGMAGVEAANGVLCLLTDDGRELEIVRAIGIRPETEENWHRFPADAPVPACDAMRSGQPVLFSSLEERDLLYPVLKGQPSNNQAFATLPLGLGGRTFGALTFGWARPREFTIEDRQFLGAVAEQCAQALDRCRLYEAEARERRRKDFVAEAGAVLASSLDYETTIQRAAELLLPELADACVVHVRTPDGLELMSAAHVDPEHERILRQLGQKDDRIARHFRLLEVALSRRPLLVDEIRPTLWDEIPVGSEERAQLQRLGLRSGLAVPLVV
ncbi:MAG TPA: GAF domain-containing protein, partial [Acidimicrobiales bacterium]|nr:GAF domain-containing protein [Acidimicrobiales bacterium]